MPSFAASSDSAPPLDTAAGRTAAASVFVLPLERLSTGMERLAGPKATRLAVAKRAGSTVPDGFVLTTAALEAWLREPLGERNQTAAPTNGTTAEPVDTTLGEAIDSELQRLFERRVAPSPREIEQSARTLAKFFARTALPEPVVQALRTAYERLRESETELGSTLPFSVAVRSSAPHEDGEQHSFAGHHDSVLDVRDFDAVVDAVCTCLTSSLSERALAAFAHGKTPPGRPRMAVLIQRMLRPDYAGILFTLDPLGASQRMIVELDRGVGEGVAAGQSDPARYALDRETGTIERLGGPESLTPPVRLLHDLAALGQRLERLFDGPQDVEWAALGGEIHLLQTRPITTIRNRLATERRDFWTSANSQEALQAPVTPMTYTLMRPLIDRGRRELFEALAIPELEGDYMRLHLGRVYFNTDYFRRFLEHLPGVPTEIFDMLLFGEKGAGMDSTLSLSRLRPSWRLLKLLPEIVRTWAGARRRMDRFPKALERRLAEHARHEPSELSTGRLWALLDETIALMEHGFRLHVLGSAMAGGHYLLLSHWLHTHAPELGHGAVDELLGAVPGVATAQAYDELLQLAEQARALPSVARAIRETPPDRALEAIGSVPGGQPLREAIDRFIATYGHLARTEAELACPRWREDRAYVMQVLKRYLERDASAGRIPHSARHDEERTRKRKALTERIEARLQTKAPWRAVIERAVFRHLLKWAERFAPYRENMRFHALRAYERVRIVLIEMGKRLVRMDRLERSEDIFFIEWDELAAALPRTTSSQPHAFEPPLRERIARRRAEYERALAIEAPKFIWDDGSPAPAPARLRRTGGRSSFIEGVAVSGGVVRGRIRLCTTLEEALAIEPGDILLARLAPPAWTPAFLLARGVILDIGGMLSHCAVIAREHGIPCVVGVRDATRLLSDGDEVTLDAYAGRVYVHHDQPNSTAAAERRAPGEPPGT